MTESPVSTLRHGLDLVDCPRIAALVKDHGERFLKRILTAAERERAARFRDPTQFIAGRFAAKEAILKMVGTGWRGQIAWTDMEILPDALGQPVVTLHGEVARIAAELGIAGVTISITHTEQFAAASVIGVVSAAT